MKDDFDDLLDRWLRDRGASDRATIRALAGNVATLPPRRRHRPPSSPRPLRLPLRSDLPLSP